MAPLALALVACATVGGSALPFMGMTGVPMVPYVPWFPWYPSHEPKAPIPENKEAVEKAKKEDESITDDGGEKKTSEEIQQEASNRKMTEELAKIERETADLYVKKRDIETQFPKLPADYYGNCYKDWERLTDKKYCAGQVSDVTKKYAEEFKAELMVIREAFRRGFGRKVLLNGIDQYFRPTMQHVVRRAKEMVAFRCSKPDHPCYAEQPKAASIDVNFGKDRRCPENIMEGKGGLDAETLKGLQHRLRQLTTALSYVRNSEDPKKALIGNGDAQIAAGVALCVRIMRTGPDVADDADINPMYYSWPGHDGEGEIMKGAGRSLEKLHSKVVPSKRAAYKQRVVVV